MPRTRPNWFIGLPVPAGSWFAVLPRPPACVRLFAPADLHVTVAFLGPVDEEAARRAFAFAARWPTGCLDAKLGRIRALGHRRKPSALSAMLDEGAPPMGEAIAAIRDDMLAAAGARPDRRPPLPHVTLARIARRSDQRERRAAIDWAERLDLGGPVVHIDRIALYTWSSDRRSRLFDIVDEQPLA